MIPVTTVKLMGLLTPSSVELELEKGKAFSQKKTQTGIFKGAIKYLPVSHRLSGTEIWDLYTSLCPLKIYSLYSKTFPMSYISDDKPQNIAA